jgi:hypothetical protein
MRERMVRPTHVSIAKKWSHALPFPVIRWCFHSAVFGGTSIIGRHLADGRYGYIFLIKGSTLTAFETTTSTCVPGLTARRKTRASAPWEAVYRSKHEGTLFFRLSGVGDHGILHLEDSVPDISIRRITKMPASCDDPTEDTPTGNFEVFTRTWAENYISFTRWHVDWNSVVAEYRGKVTGETMPAQLFDIFQSMIKPLGDLHTYITAPSLKRASGDTIENSQFPCGGLIRGPILVILCVGLGKQG